MLNIRNRNSSQVCQGVACFLQGPAGQLWPILVVNGWTNFQNPWIEINDGTKWHKPSHWPHGCLKLTHCSWWYHPQFFLDDLRSWTNICSNPQKNLCGFLNGSSRYFGRSHIICQRIHGLLNGIFGHPKKSKHPRITHSCRYVHQQHERYRYESMNIVWTHVDQIQNCS